MNDLVAHLVTDTSQWKAGLDKAKSDISSFASDLTTSLAGVAAAFGGIMFVKDSIGAAESDIAATQKLEAVLAATGNVAGVTSDEINQLASDLQKLTKFEDDATVGAAAILATFKGISGDQFKETVRLAQDLSALKDIGLTESVTMLGKALNDPAEGFAKLTKLGLQFTDQQKAQITAMAEAGDAAGAQTAMLKVLEETFGGVAQASVKESEKWGLALGNISEEIGKILLPGIVALGATALPILQDWSHEIGVVAVAVGGLIGILTALVAIQKGVAIAQAAILSLGGPAGWAALAAGAAAFAVAVGGIETAMAGLGDETRATTELLKAQKEEIIVLGGGFPEPDAFGAGADFGGGDFGLPVDDDFKKRISEIADEIAVLSGAATEASIEVDKMMKAGLGAEDAEALKRALTLRDELKKSQQASLDMDRQAAAIRDSVRTPEETLDAKIKELEKLKEAGKIDQETFDKAKKKAEEDTGVKSTPTDMNVGAVGKGTSEAMQTILAASNGNQGIAEQQLAIAEEQVEQLAQANTTLENLQNGGMTLVIGSFA